MGRMWEVMRAPRGRAVQKHRVTECRSYLYYASTRRLPLRSLLWRAPR